MPLPFHAPRNILGRCLGLSLLLIVSLGFAQAPSPDLLAPLINILRTTDNAQFQHDLLKGITDALTTTTQRPPPEGWREIESDLLKSPAQPVRELALGLALKFSSEQAFQIAFDQIRDRSQPTPQRQQSLKALIQSRPKNLEELLLSLLADADLRAEAIRGLTHSHNPQVAAALLSAYPNLSRPEKQSAIAILSQRIPFAQALLDAMEAGIVSRQEVSVATVNQLARLKAPEITNRLTHFWGTIREPQGNHNSTIQNYRELIQRTDLPSANAEAGRLVYAMTCQQCHQLFDMGGQIGPEITGADRQSLDYLLQNIVDPNRLIPIDYQTTTIDTRDDRVLSGIVSARSPEGLTLQTTTQTFSLRTEDIADIQQSTLSLMPEGLLDLLSPTDVRNLMAYLQSPSQVPVPATELTQDLFFNRRDLTNWAGNPAVWRVERDVLVGTVMAPENETVTLSSLMSFSQAQITFETRFVATDRLPLIQLSNQPLLIEDRPHETKPAGSWNRVELNISDEKAFLWVNGQRTNELRIESSPGEYSFRQFTIGIPARTTDRLEIRDLSLKIPALD